jgi:hypothetical protein
VIRTHNLLHESPPLYQLRYAGHNQLDDSLPNFASLLFLGYVQPNGPLNAKEIQPN